MVCRAVAEDPGRRGDSADRCGAAGGGRVTMSIRVDKTLWAQARTLYLRAHPGHQVALVEWVDRTVNDYLDRRAADIAVPAGDDGRTVQITVDPGTRQRILDTVEEQALRGRGVSRSAVVSAALRRAVAEAGGSSVPVHRGRLPRGRRPRS